MYNAKGLVEHAKYCLRCPNVYMKGGLMRILTESYINQLVKMYPRDYTITRVTYLKSLVAQSYGCDCVGLIKSYYFGGVGSPDYDLKKDLNTDGYFSIATEKGSIKSLPETPGVILYMEGHVGVYIGNGECIECTWGNYGDGIVKTQVSGRGWTHWLKIPYIDYTAESDKCYCKCNCEACSCNKNELLYKVLPGDSFWRIADKLWKDGSRFKEICDYNNMSPNTVIKPGDILRIPTKEVK